ncbi:MAG: DNA primase [Patescibacteria group bacterium]
MPDNIEEIKSKVDVVDLIQEYIQLKPAGTNSFKANCPFHNEKTPSFVVSRDKQIWHCFGCGEGGDIFTFVQQMEGLEFPEALRMLARKAGVQLQYQDPAISSRKTKLYDICKAAADFYHKLLLDHPKAQFVREYLGKRGVSGETVSRWQLGYAPDAWDVLSAYLKKKYPEDDIFQAGLTLKKDRGVGFNDRFRNRLMFPIWDTNGNTVGFGGRWLGKEENIAKYINTPQTIIYNKSNVLYGIDKAKTDIKKSKLAVVVEGYMDCIASHQAGVTNVVASSGTALTPDQVRLLKRFTSHIAFAFDQDLAGDTAAKRGIEVAWQEEMSTKVILLPGASKDPDELIKEQGVGVWKRAIQEAQSVMDYYFESTLKNVDATDVEVKKSAAKTLLPVIAKLVDQIEQTHYLQKLATTLRVDERVLRDKLGQLRAKALRPSAPAANLHEKKNIDRFHTLAESVVGIALNYPDLVPRISETLPPDYIQDEQLRRLYKQAIVYYTEKHIFDYRAFLKMLGSADGGASLRTYAEVLSLRVEHEYASLDERSLEQLVTHGIRELKAQHVRSALRDVEAQLREAEANRNSAAVDQLSARFTELTAELKQSE